MARRRRREVQLQLKRKDGTLVNVKNPTIAATLQTREAQVQVLSSTLEVMTRERNELKATLDRLLANRWLNIGAFFRFVRVERKEKSHDEVIPGGAPALPPDHPRADRGRGHAEAAGDSSRAG